MEAKCSRRRSESTVLFKSEHAAQARARWHVRSGHAGLGRRTKNIGFCMGKRENAQHAQARAHFSKCVPRASESSTLPTQDGAHDHVSKQNEHRAEAGTPFSIKKCTAHTREPQKVKTEPRKCARCSGTHPTNRILVQPDVRGAQQSTAK